MSVIRPCGMCDPKLPSNGSVRVPSVPEFVCPFHAEMFWRGLSAERRQTAALQHVVDTMDQRLYDDWQENDQRRDAVVNQPQSGIGTSAA